MEMKTFVKPIYNEDGTIYSFGAGVQTKKAGMIWYAAGFKDVQTALEQATKAKERLSKEYYGN
jgi:hypothetical protein